MTLNIKQDGITALDPDKHVRLEQDKLITTQDLSLFHFPFSNTN